MMLTFDHAIILVHDLETARADYQNLGFKVVYGGQHADGQTHNALIVFQDGSYLELLAPVDPAQLNPTNPQYHTSFLRLFQHGEGFGGFAFQSDELETEVAQMQARGLNVQLRPPGGRIRPDGQALQWRTATLENTMTPFFIQDITPRHLRVPTEVQTMTHPNGVTGVSELVINTRNLDNTIQRYQMISGSQNVGNFQLGSIWIHLATAPDSNLAQREETLSQITLSINADKLMTEKPLPGGGLLRFSHQ